MSFLLLFALRQAMQHCITNKEIMALLVFSFFATWIIGHTIKTLSFFKLFLSTNCYILLPT